MRRVGLKKAIWCGVALAACISVLTFGRSLAFLCVQKIASRSDCVITAEQVHFGRGGLSLAGVHASGSFGEVDAKSCDLLLRFAMRPFGFKLHVNLDRPVWTPAVKSGGGGKGSSFVHLMVKDGHIKKGDAYLPFAFTSGMSKNDIGLLELDNGAFEVMLKRGDEGTFVVSRFLDADLARLQPLAPLIKKKIAWVPQQGKAHGYFSFAWTDEGDITDVTGDLELIDPAFWHARRQLKVGANRFSMKGTFPAQEVHLDGGYLLALHSRLPAQWGLQLSGSVTPDRFKTAIALKGAVVREDAYFPLAIEGEGKITGNQSLLTTLNIAGAGKSDITFELARGGFGKIVGEFDQISSKQLLLFRDGLAAFIPALCDLEMQGTACTARVEASLARMQLQKVVVDHVVADAIAIKWPSKNIEGCAHNVQAKGTLPFEDGPKWRCGQWDLEIEQGDIADFATRHLKIAIDGDAIKECRFDGIYQGLQIDGLGEGTVLSPQLSLSISGSTRHLAKIFETTPSEDLPFSARVLLEKKGEVLSLASRMTSERGGKCSFGLSCTAADLKARKSDSLTGWCEAEKVSPAIYAILLEKLSCPTQVSGTINLSGTINHSDVTLDLTSPELNLKTANYHITLPSLDKQPIIRGPLAQVASIGYAEDKLHLTVPLVGASVLDLGTGLKFENLNGKLQLDGDQLTCDDLKGRVCDTDFAGRIEVQLQEKPDVHFVANAIDGDAKDLISILKRFDRFADLHLPLSGRVGACQAPALDIDTASGTFHGQLQLTKGRFDLTEKCYGDDLSCKITCAQDGTLCLAELDGSLIACDSAYEVSAPKLNLLDPECGLWEYDLRIESQTHDLMRFTGKLERQDGSLSVSLDEQYSHLFGAPIHLQQCELNSDHTVNKIAVKTQVKLAKLHTLCQFIDALEVFELSAPLREDVKKMRLQGSVDLDWSLDDQWMLSCHGTDLKIKEHPLSEFGLQIECDDESFSLDHLQLGNFVASALCDREDTTWNLNFFEARLNQTLLMAHAGSYDTSTKEMAVDFDKCSVDLAQFAALLDMPNNYLGGLVNLNNCTLRFDGNEKALAAQFDIDCPEYSKANFALSSKAPVQLTYNREHGVCLHNAHLQFGQPEQAGIKGECHIGNIDYHVRNKSLSCDDFSISLTPEFVLALADSELLPSVSTNAGKLLIANIPVNWDNHLESKFSFCLSPGSFSLLADLKDGYYWIGDLSCHLRNSKIKGTNNGLRFTSCTQLQSAEFNVEAHVPFDKQRNPKITLSDSTENTNPLTLTFSHDSNSLVDAAVGHFCGLDFNFHAKPHENNSANLALTGEVSIDWNAAAKLLPDKMAQAIQDFDLGLGYKIAGDLAINLNNVEKSSFEGYFKGKEFEALGYKFQNMLATLRYVPGSLTLEGLTVADDALSINVPQVCVVNQQLSIPELKVQDFRPSRLSKVGRRPRRLKPFVVRQLDFYNICGNINDKNSLTGSGQLSFINTFKRDVGFFDIPKELIGRIGLDAGLLVPVKGQLKCSLKDGRFYFNELMDAYSDGERSEFFLSNRTQNYIDFDGRVHIDIRMKQFVLLRITEMFTLSLRGTVEHPKYKIK